MPICMPVPTNYAPCTHVPARGTILEGGAGQAFKFAAGGHGAHLGAWRRASVSGPALRQLMKLGTRAAICGCGRCCDLVAMSMAIKGSRAGPNPGMDWVSITPNPSITGFTVGNTSRDKDLPDTCSGVFVRYLYKERATPRLTWWAA